jgi:hypothetical protein
MKAAVIRLRDGSVEPREPSSGVPQEEVAVIHSESGG